MSSDKINPDFDKQYKDFLKKWTENREQDYQEYEPNKSRTTAIKLQNYSAGLEEQRLNCGIYTVIYIYHDGDKLCSIKGNEEFVKSFLKTESEKIDFIVMQGKDVTKEFEA